MIRIIRLDPDADFDRVADLFRRAADYVRLERGSGPDAAYVQECLSEAPPQIRDEDFFNFGLERPDGKLAGFAGSIRGYYKPNEWYMGLLLLDPAVRGQGLGRLTLDHVREVAVAHGAPVMRIAVLDANLAGRRFWEREGFVHERTVPGDPEGDGHIRHVLKLDLGETADV